MVDDVLFEILNESDMVASLDFPIIIACLCLGFILKHVFEKLSNQTIPCIITFFCIAITMFKYIAGISNYVNSCDAIVNAIICSAISIGLHTNAKHFKKFFIRNAKNTIDNMYEDDNEENDV